MLMRLRAESELQRLMKTRSVQGRRGSARWRCVLQDGTNHSAITLTTVTKRSVLITAPGYAVCRQVPITKCDY